MHLKTEETYIHNGIEYRIRLYRDNTGYKAAAYLNDRQVTIIHSVEDSTDFGFFKKYGDRYATMLIDDVKADIQQGFLNT